MGRLKKLQQEREDRCRLEDELDELDLEEDLWYQDAPPPKL